MTMTYSELKAQRHAALAPVEAELARRGFAVEQQELALRCPILVGEAHIGYAFFVTAEFLFSVETQALTDEDDYDREERESGKRHFDISLRVFQSEVMQAARDERKECRLFVLADEGSIPDLDLRRRSRIEYDETYAIQRVCTLDQALVMLTNPFPPREQDTDKPTFDAVQELFHLKDDAPAVDLYVEPKAMYAEPNAELLCAEDSAKLRERIEAIFMQAAGPEFKFFWEQDEVRIGRVWDKRGVPLAFASAGEQRLFAFAYFLATEGLQHPPGARMGIYGLLNGLSLLWYIGALNVLRQYSHATGVSVRLQVPALDRQRAAKRWMEPVANVIEVRKYPYNV
ncbi:hypothetical protein AB4Y45_32420 [Paraburkholderia sp. EG287A]|uniref:hypothetical protein n=1 Tax=Paraburkholderia sp. EG287A TaxID=3237012 RepID=UPI0034D31E8D